MFAESGETSGGHGNAVTTTLGLGQVVPPGKVGMLGTGTHYLLVLQTWVIGATRANLRFFGN